MERGRGGAPGRRPGLIVAGAAAAAASSRSRTLPRALSTLRSRLWTLLDRRLSNVELRLDHAAGLLVQAVPGGEVVERHPAPLFLPVVPVLLHLVEDLQAVALEDRSEEHTSELQSQSNL